MSETLEFRMQNTEGRVFGLDSLLSLVPKNNWAWSVMEFDGIVLGTKDSEYAGIRQQVASSPRGYVMPWAQVQEFATEVHQCFDLLIVAAGEHHLLDPKQLAAGDFTGFPLTITASDSAWWTVKIDLNAAATADLAARIRERYSIEMR